MPRAAGFPGPAPFVALSAERGARAYPEILDDKQAYLRMPWISRYDRGTFNAKLGRERRLSNIAYKPWPVSWWMVHPLTALDTLMQQHQFDLDAIDRVVVEITPLILALNVCLDPRPRDFFNRQHSFPHGHAMLLLGVPPGISWLSPDDALESRGAPLRDKIEIRAHPGATSHTTDIARGEFRRVLSRITVHIGNRTYQAETAYARGDACQYAWGNDMSPTSFGHLSDPTMLRNVVDSVLNAETLQDVAAITNFMQALRR